MDAEPNYAMINHYKNLEQKREKARASGDALKYFRLTNEAGSTVEPEDYLFEQGQADAMILDAQENANLIISREDKSKLERMARVALPRFSESEIGESISDKEISRRLRNIRKAGYDVPAYGKLSRDEKWELLKGIRSDLGSKLRKESPEVADEIDAQNNQQKYEGREFR